MKPESEPLLDAWRINDRVTTFLVERIPAELWRSSLPASPRRTVRSIAAHLHNARRMWLRGLGAGVGVSIPTAADRLQASPRVVAAALRQSGTQILHMLEAGIH